MKKNKIVEYKINKPIAKHRKDDTVRIKCDLDGVPLDRYWRDRLKDAKVDNCMEMLKDKKKKAGSSEAQPAKK